MSELFCLFIIKKVLTCKIKWNTFFSDSARWAFNSYCHHRVKKIFLNAKMSMEIEYKLNKKYDHECFSLFL